ncbi:MAG: YbjN domain-containing protein [Polyangiaceae bacterium]|nr:YbjN domain-containing protein [Polyangiaceae bacterium]
MAKATRKAQKKTRSPSARKKPAAKRAVAKRKAPAKKAPARKAPAKKAPARKAPARKAPARKAPAKKAPAKKAPAKKAPAKKAPAKRAASSRGNVAADVVVSRVFDHAEWEWSLEASGNEKYFVVHVPEGEKLGIHAELYEDDQRLVLYTTFLDPTPKPRRGQVMEFVTRANFGLVSGNFEMDLESGYVRFKSTVDFADTTLDLHWVKNLILHSIEATDAYCAALGAVADGTSSAKEAIIDVEGHD